MSGLGRASRIIAIAAAILAAPAVARAQAEYSVIHAFTPPSGDERGAEPAAIVRASDGRFYGTTTSGGTFNRGTVFALNPDGLVTWLHSFAPGEGRLPNALVQASDGHLYGTTRDNDDGSPGGAAFRITTAGAFSVLHTFTGGAADGLSPSNLIEGIDGNFYGTSAYGGSSIGGTVFRMTADGLVTVLHAFNGTDGGRPHAGLVQANDGTFYGTTTEGGTLGRGTVFKMAVDGSLSVLQSVHAHDDFNHPSRMPGLTLATDGNLYGAVPKGTFDSSVFFKMTPAGEFTTLTAVPQNPTGPPIQALDGRLYAITVDGTVYVIALDGTVESLTTSAGNFNLGTLISTSDGRLYGTARYWPDPAAGSVFRLDVPMPLMTIDEPGPSPASVVQPFWIKGWALDLGPDPSGGTGVDAVHVWAFPASGAPPIFVGAAHYGTSRPDVAVAFGSTRFTNSGFELSVRGLAGGTYRLDAFAHRTASGAFDLARSVAVTMPDPQPLLLIDAPAPDAAVGPTFAISGWAIDPRATSGTGIDAVHVYAYPASGGAPIFAGGTTNFTNRPDVGAIFGSQFTQSGYSFTSNGLEPGSYTLVVFTLSSVSGSWTAQTRNITVRDGNTVMWVDTPKWGDTVSSSFTISGWAADTDSATGTGVDMIHVWAYSSSLGTQTFLGAANYGLPRPDVGAYLGDARFSNSGFSLNAAGLSPGEWALVVFAHSALTGSFLSGQPFVVRITVN